MRRAAPLLLLALLAACTEPSAPPAEPAAEPVRGGTLVLGSISDVDAWNEAVSAQSFAANLHRLLFLRLAREKGKGGFGPEGFTPELAESWSFGEDGKSLTFHLAEASWSDGTPVTAEDVRFTWQAQTSPDVGWVGADSKKNVTDVTVDDPRTVTFHFARVTPFLFANAVEGGILPRHAFGKEPFREWRTHDWSKEPIATGPFLLQAHAPGQEIVLVRNPKAPLPAPLLDKVVIRIVPDVGSLLTQVEAGEIDYMEGAPPREIKRLTTVPTVKTYAFDYPMVDYLGWNEAKPPLNDPEVRRALTLAIDRQALVDELLGGLGKVAAGPLPSFFPGADAKLAPLPYDPAESKRILAAKGYGEGKRPLKLEVVTNLGNRVREEALVRIQAQLAQVGVELSPRPLEMASLRTRVSAGDFDATLAGWRWTGTPDLAPLFGSEARPPRGSNVVGYRSSDADAALAAASAAERWEDTQVALARLQAALHRDQPCTFLWETARLAVARRQVQGVAPLPADPLGWLRTAWIATEASGVRDEDGIARYAQLQRELQELRRRYADTHPDVLHKRKEIEDWVEAHPEVRQR